MQRRVTAVHLEPPRGRGMYVPRSYSARVASSCLSRCVQFKQVWPPWGMPSVDPRRTDTQATSPQLRSHFEVKMTRCVVDLRLKPDCVCSFAALALRCPTRQRATRRRRSVRTEWSGRLARPWQALHCVQCALQRRQRVLTKSESGWVTAHHSALAYASAGAQQSCHEVEPTCSVCGNNCGTFMEVLLALAASVCAAHTSVSAGRCFNKVARTWLTYDPPLPFAQHVRRSHSGLSGLAADWPRAGASVD